MNEARKEEIKKYAEIFLGTKSLSSCKHYVCRMFDEWREMVEIKDPRAEEFLEEVKIWDDVYHSMK